MQHPFKFYGKCKNVMIQCDCSAMYRNRICADFIYLLLDVSLQTGERVQVEPEMGAQHCAKGLRNLWQSFGDAPLTPHNVELCHTLAQHLARERCQGQAMPASVLLPDEKCVLRQMHSLYFIEASAAGWLKAEEVARNMHLLHPSIPEKLAVRLGIASLRMIHQVPFLPLLTVGLIKLMPQSNNVCGAIAGTTTVSKLIQGQSLQRGVF